MAHSVREPRSWLLWLGTFLCLTAALISAALNAFSVQWMIPDGKVQNLGIAASVVLDAWKFLTPMLVVLMWQARMRLGAISCALVGLLPFAISFTMAAMFLVITRTDGVSQRTANADARQDLRTELQRYEAQLGALGVQRPVAAVRAQLDALSVTPTIWRDSNECRLNSEYWRRACREVVRTRMELATTQAYEVAASRVSELKGELARSEIASPGNPLALLIADTTGFDGERGAMWFSLLFAAAIEIVAGLGLAFVHLTDQARWLVHQSDADKRPPSSVSLLNAGLSDRAAVHAQPSWHRVKQRKAPGLKPGYQNEQMSAVHNLDKLGFAARTKPGDHPSQLARTNGEFDRRTRGQSSRKARRDTEEASVRVFLSQLSNGPDHKTQAERLHVEYLRRADAHGWPLLNKTAFGRRATTMLGRLGYAKRKEGAVAMYYGIGLAEQAYQPILG